MNLLILGLALWVLAHFFKRFAPAARAGLGDSGKALVAAAIGAGLILMIFGYRWSDFIPVWTPPAAMVHVNNLLMILAVWTLGSGYIKGGKLWPATRVRHPMLVSVMIWAVAHLLVNGDLASIVLFGGLLVWAIAEVQVINRADPGWTAPPQAPAKKWLTLTIITLVVFAVITAIHAGLGVWPFPG